MFQSYTRRIDASTGLVSTAQRRVKDRVEDAVKRKPLLMLMVWMQCSVVPSHFYPHRLRQSFPLRLAHIYIYQRRRKKEERKEGEECPLARLNVPSSSLPLLTY